MVDILIVLFLLGLYYLGRERGIIQELTDIVAIIGGFFLSSHLGPVLTELVLQIQIAGKPLPKGIVSALVYIAVFMLGGFLILVIGSIIDIASKKTFMEDWNRALGGLIGFIKGIILCWFITFLILISPISEINKTRFINTVYSARYLVRATPYIYSVISPLMSTRQRELTEDFMKWWKKNERKIVRER